MTWINHLQAPYVIAELQHINLDDKNREIADGVIETLQGIENHKYVKFLGD